MAASGAGPGVGNEAGAVSFGPHLGRVPVQETRPGLGALDGRGLLAGAVGESEGGCCR